MYATLVTEAPPGDEWAWELKWDGVRARSATSTATVRGWSAATATTSPAGTPNCTRWRPSSVASDAVLDGEIVAFDADGRPSFQRLQSRMHVEDAGTILRLAQEVPAVYVLFDLLRLDGELQLAAAVRRTTRRLARARLDRLVVADTTARARRPRNPRNVSRQFNLEGVVAKRVDSPYRPGKRTREWLKLKNQLRQEFVVGGYTVGEGRRHGALGALLIGYYDDDDVLHYAGKVGTGFTDADLERLRAELDAHRRDTSPFGAGAPAARRRVGRTAHGRRSALQRVDERRCPRHPAYLGVRDDKSPLDVRREG